MGNVSVLELQVLTIIRKRATFLKYEKYLHQSFFSSIETRTIFDTIIDYHYQIRGGFLSLKDLWMLIEKKVDEEDHLLYRSILKKMKIDDGDRDEKVVEYTLKRFSQESMLKETIEGVVNRLENNSEVMLHELKTKIGDIISLNGNSKVADYDYVSQHDDRLKISSEPKRLATGLSSELDIHLKGGLGQGELGFILAPPGRGKTLALVNIGASALRHGKKVLHLTLEIKARIVAKRYDCALTDSSVEDILDNPDLLRNRLKEIQETGAKLVIKDYSYMHCGIADLHGVLEEYKGDGEKFDLVIVDYADLMIPPQHYKDTRHEVAKIYEELRIIAGEYNIPVWTASQSNRASLSKRVVKMDDIAEAFSKANIADLIIALCQTEDEKQSKTMRLFVAKTRMTSTNPIVSVIADPDRMIIKAYKDYDTVDITAEHRIKQIRKKATKNVQSKT